MHVRFKAVTVACLLVVGIVAPLQSYAAAQPHFWDFSVTGDYVYNQAEIRISAGIATMIPMQDQTLPDTAAIYTKVPLAYEDLAGFSAETTGTVRFQLSNNGSTWYAVEPQVQNWRAQSSDLPESSHTAADLNIYISSFAKSYGPGNLYVKAILYKPESGQPAPSISTITVQYEGAVAEEPPAQNPDLHCFNDVSASHPDAVAICELKSRGIVNGVDGTLFLPNNTVRRGEAFKIALAGRDVSAYEHAENPFVDLPSGHTLKAWILYLFHNHIINGYDATHVGPDNSLTEAEAAKVILNLNGITTVSDTNGETYGMPSDSPLIPYVYTALYKNLMRDGKPAFKASRGMTRGKIASMMYRVLMMNENGWPAFQE